MTPAEPELHQNNSKISVSLTRASEQKFQGCRFGLDIRKGLLLERLKRKTYAFCEVVQSLALGSITALYQGRVPGTQRCAG